MEDDRLFAQQGACRRCGALKGYAMRPLRDTPTGWICGYCVEQLSRIAAYSASLRAPVVERPEQPAPAPESYPTVQEQLPLAERSPTITAAGAALLNAVGREPRTEQEIIAASGKPRSSVKRALRREVARGAVLRIEGAGPSEPYRYRRP